MTGPTPPERFAGIARLYGRSGYGTIASLSLCIVGIGGVGSWAAEALARLGVGQLTLIDPDDLCVTNINRQIHALEGTIGRSKVEVMAERVAAINPACRCLAIDDRLSGNNIERLISSDIDGVVDAIDVIQVKAALIAHCRRRRLPVVTAGGAGGRTDPGLVTVADLSRTWNDPLAAKVRSRLRRDYRFPDNPKRRFGVDCVFSTQQPLYPTAEGGVSCAKPGAPGATLDCNRGYGASPLVTPVFGLVAANRLIERVMARRQKPV